LKEWVVIHKIKGLYDEGRGLSLRAISLELDISRNTVRKYVQMDETQISAYQGDRSRHKRLDAHRDFLIHQLKRFPKLSAVKLARRLQERGGELEVSSRSIRRYVQTLKEQVATGQLRYYEPVPQSVPGIQCQVDPGELRGVLIGGQERTVHFVVFVLSCSRLMYVGLAFKPLDTAAFIQLRHTRGMCVRSNQVGGAQRAVPGTDPQPAFP
jgi:transposase